MSFYCLTTVLKSEKLFARSGNETNGQLFGRLQYDFRFQDRFHIRRWKLQTEGLYQLRNGYLHLVLRKLLT